MSSAVLFGAAASSALVLGAIAGISWKPPPGLLATILAFAAGALTAALAFELFEVSFARGGSVTSSVGLLTGAVVFVAIDSLLDRRVRSTGSSGLGLALLAAVTLDGVPENAALGTTLAGGGGSIALLVAIFASNLPEALVGARSMCDNGRSKRFVMVTWTVAACLLAGAVVLGARLLDAAGGGTLSAVLAFAGGAVLASLVNTLFPKAYEEGGPWVALATVAGFLLSFLLGAA